MRKIDTPDGLFHQSKPGDPTPSTRVTDWWLNGVQSEIINVIENLGKAQLNDGDNTQLATAIDRFFKYGYASVGIDIPGTSSTPLDIPLDLEKDGGYFYIFSGVSEQLGAPTSTVTPFELIAFRDNTRTWRGFQQDFIPTQKAPITIHVSGTGKLSVTTQPEWGSGKGKLYLSVSKREKMA
jgi:hypothetical protein